MLMTSVSKGAGSIGTLGLSFIIQHLSFIYDFSRVERPAHNSLRHRVYGKNVGRAILVALGVRKEKFAECRSQDGPVVPEQQRDEPRCRRICPRRKVRGSPRGSPGIITDRGP